MSELRDQYFATLNIGKTEILKRRRALNRAYALRTFEIEHYWKRATYFWAFQVAIFAAFGLLWKDTNPGTKPVSDAWSPIAVALAGLGILTALASALSARGSSFWQNNWEKHIDMLEDEIEGRLYKTMWLSEGRVSFSVSRVNQYLSDYFVLFWALIAFYVACTFVGSNEAPGVFHDNHLLRLNYVILLDAFVLGGVVLFFGQTTRTGRATLPKANGSHGDDKVKRDWNRPHWRWLDLRRHIVGACRMDSQTFIRRYAPDEPNVDKDS